MSGQEIAIVVLGGLLAGTAVALVVTLRWERDARTQLEEEREAAKRRLGDQIAVARRADDAEAWLAAVLEVVGPVQMTEAKVEAARGRATVGPVRFHKHDAAGEEERWIGFLPAPVLAYRFGEANRG